MAHEMQVQAQLLSGNSFAVETGSGHTITLAAAFDKGGENPGPRPMEMLLTALAGCAGIGVIGIVRKMQQDVTGYEIRIRGERAESHPQVFTHIVVEHIFTGRNLQARSLQRAIDLDAERYCGVNIMLGAAVQIVHRLEIREAK